MITKSQTSHLIGSFLFLVSLGFAAFGQQSPPLPKIRLAGRIVDQTGAVIAGASVSAARVGEKVAVLANTDGNGEFGMSLEPGRYAIKVDAPGFKDTSRTIEVGQAGDQIEFVLPVGDATAFVTISTSAGYAPESISSATKVPTLLRDVPQSISVVSREQIADQMFSSVADAVRFTPGIEAHQGENNRDDLIIRGNRSSAGFFVNGVRDDVQYYRDFYNVEQVEAVKGPNALLFGRGGGGGVVNRVTKDANFTRLREIAVQGGSFYNRRITADFGQPLGKRWAFRAAGVFENSDSFRRFVNLRRAGFNPTVTFQADEKTRIKFSYEFFRDRRTADRGVTSFALRPANVKIGTFYGDPEQSRVRANVNAAGIVFERQFGDFFLRNSAHFGDYDRFYQNFVPGAPNASATLVSISAYNNAGRRRNLFDQTDITWVGTTGSVRHTVLGGFEFGDQRTRNFRQTGYFNNVSTSIMVPFDDPVTSAPVTFRQSASDADNRVRLALGAGYIQDQLEITRFLQILGGIRFDYFDLNYTNRRNGDRLRRIDRLVSPRLGVVLKPIERLSLYGSLSVSYLPSSGDQFASLTSVTQQLKPERFTNFEIGAKFDLRRGISLTAALYRLDRTNTRATDPNNPAAIIQTGKQRSNGFETGLSGNLLKRLTVSGGYSYQDAFIVSSTTAAIAGKKIAQVPRHTFSLWNKYSITNRLSAGFGLTGKTASFAAADNSVRLPGFVRTDAAVYYNLGEHWRLQANIDNVFGVRHFVNADGNTNISPGTPRSVRFGLTARF